ncbi:histone-lysine N-methyltransferase SETMAR [Trichonephila clavipes]|nr:histone-lysine N-methyltransferase SETMAR [Trichonephila clavipes]
MKSTHFLNGKVTGDEKGVTYDNIGRKQSWSKRSEAVQTVAKPELEKRPEWANRRGAVFHQDNARPHSSVVTRQKLWELGWEVVMHPPYSPDLEPSDYDLFLTLQNFLRDKKLRLSEECENQLLDSFANKGLDFYERGIMKLHLK